jgi:2',3'-cyclic-nucleotide 2'-phosphodiesterase (5'-nucleotidase family)
VDAFAVGNHEFDHGWERIADYRRIAAFPLLSANVTDPDGELIADLPWKLFDVDGVRVAVIGLTTPTTPEITAGGMTAGCTFRPALQAVGEALLPAKAHSDLVVLLSHLGHEDDVKLAEAIEGIDVIVGGHSHTVLPEPVMVGRTLIVQAGSYGKHLGRLELTVDLESGSVKTYDGRLITVTGDFPTSGRTAAAVSIWEDKVRERVDVVIGRAETELGKRALKTRIEAVFRETLATELAYQNPGGIRATLPAGDILIRHIWTILPFENTLVTVEVKGENLPEHLRAAAGEIDPHHVYTVATNSFVSAHLPKYFPDGVEGVIDSGVMMRDAVVEWVRERGGL